jgi:hypothetical protein
MRSLTLQNFVICNVEYIQVFMEGKHPITSSYFTIWKYPRCLKDGRKHENGLVQTKF